MNINRNQVQKKNQVHKIIMIMNEHRKPLVNFL